MNMLGIDDLRAGDVLLYKADSALARLICDLDSSEVSHAGLYLGDGRVAEALALGDRWVFWGNAGLNCNPIAESIKKCIRVEAARLKTCPDLRKVLTKADELVAEHHPYAYIPALRLALILLTRKWDQQNPSLRWLADLTFWYCAGRVDKWRSQDGESMICSEFVFRAYDEALPDKLDQYTIEIIAQGTGQPTPVISRRRLGASAAAPPTELPTVHPESLLARIIDEPEGLAAAPMLAGPPKTAAEIEAEIEAAALEYLGEPPPLRATAGLAGETDAATAEDVDAAAAALAIALVRSDGFSAKPSSPGGMYTAPPDIAEHLKQIVADFVTPGDLHRSPSLLNAGKLDLKGFGP